MDFENIIVDERDGIFRITFNKPPLNVLDIAMMKEINAALGDLKGRNLKALVIGAEGKAFSAGVDISDHQGDKVREMIEVFHDIFRNMREIDAPIIALVNGAALGGGCEVVAACDLIIASEKAKFGQPEIMVGVLPPVAAAIFPRILGPRKGLELILTGDTIKAPEAKELGLVNQVFPVESFEEEAEAYITEKLATKSAVVLRLTKRAFLEGASSDYDSAIGRIEDIYLNELMETADANEGLAAFLEKRPPVWKDE